MTEPKDRYLKVNGLTIHYLDWGNTGAPIMLILHGVTRFAHAMDGIARFFADRFQVLAYDLRGHGTSDWDPKGRYSLDTHRSDLESVIDVLNLENIVLLGHSLGGSIAMSYMYYNPGHVVKSAVIEDVGPYIEKPITRPSSIQTGLERTPKLFASWEEATDYWKKIRPELTKPALERRLNSSMQVLENGTVSWIWDISGVLNHMKNGPKGTDDRWDYVKAITCPTLVIRGSESEILSQEIAARMSNVNPHISWVEVPEAGHAVHADNVDSFNSKVSAFLRNTD